MTDKGLNIFDDCAAEFVYLCRQEKEYISSSWCDIKIDTPGTIAYSQIDRVLTEINRNGAFVKVRILVKLRML